MKILLLGASGYIGKAFREEIHRRGHGFYMEEHGEVWKETFSPSSELSAVINCAAFVCKPSVELNENEKEKTIIGNLCFAQMVSNACERNGVAMLHVSSGCLYQDPIQTDPQRKVFSETDEPHLTFDKGAGFYVGSKELAERVVRQYEKHWICRTRLPFDQFENPRNFLTKLMAYPKILDTYNSLSHRGDFVKACLDMIEKRVPFGTYNCTNPGAVWSHEIAAMLTKAGLKNQFEYWIWSEFEKTRKTPMSNAELDVSKLLATGVKMRTVQEALEDSIDKWKWDSNTD